MVGLEEPAGAEEECCEEDDDGEDGNEEEEFVAFDLEWFVLGFGVEGPVECFDVRVWHGGYGGCCGGERRWWGGKEVSEWGEWGLVFEWVMSCVVGKSECIALFIVAFGY